jgi:hypothetical protein
VVDENEDDEGRRDMPAAQAHTGSTNTTHQHIPEARSPRSALASLSYIIEGHSEANVLPMLRAVLGVSGEGLGEGVRGTPLSDRVFLMDRECLRGNARMCSHYFYVRELVICDGFPHRTGIAAPVALGLQVAHRRLALFYSDLLPRSSDPAQTLKH